jgi:hypothetical protein
MRFRILLFITVAFALAKTSYAGTISSCANSAGSPTDVGGTLYTSFTCSLYNDASSYTINLTSLMTQGGANLYDNIVGAGYLVVINGDPNTLSAGDTNEAALYNESLWKAVLFWPGDQASGSGSDSLTMYWPGAFPTASTVQTVDEFLYGGPGSDSSFFVAATGSETVYAPGEGDPGVTFFNEYDIYTTPVSTPEPGTMLLLCSGLAMLGGVVLRRRRGALRAA